MITLTFTMLFDDDGDELLIEAWLCGAVVSRIKKSDARYFSSSWIQLYDTPETLQELTILAQPVLSALKKHFEAINP
jgi:hypothetical protein